MTRIRCRQLAPQVGEPAANHELILQSVRDAGAVDLLVLPELASSGYVFRDAEEARSLALSRTGDQVAEWVAAVPGDTVVACGYAELGEDDVVYNSALLFNGEGILANYRKVHLWDREKTVFAPGDVPAPVVETAVGRLALMVCYDLEFPEYTRGAALRGADALVIPTNWPLVERPSGEKPPEVLIAQAAARVNKVAVVLCDRTGTERGQEWTAGTAIVGHDGWLVAEAGPDGTAEGDLDLRAGRDKRIGPLNDLFGDRRVGLY